MTSEPSAPPRLRLSALLVLVIAGVMSVFAAVRVHFKDAEVEAHLKGDAQQVAARVSREVRPTIWEVTNKSVERRYPAELAETILDAELESPLVQGVYVYGNFGHLFMGRHKSCDGVIETYDENSEEPTHLDHSRLSKHPIRQGSMTIGSVAVLLSMDYLAEEQARIFWTEVFQALAIALLCAGFLFVSINRVLLKPLHQVMQLQTANQRQQEILDSIHKGTASRLGEEFLVNLAETLCDALDVDCALVGEIAPRDLTKVEISAAYVRSGEALPPSFDLPGTLAERVILEGAILGQVPTADPIAKLLNAQSACGVSLLAPDGEPIGFMMILHRQPLRNEERAMAVLEVFAARAGAELARERAAAVEMALREQLERSQRQETLGTLAGGIAHDFNNLLLPMSGYAELALERVEKDERMRGYLDSILDATKRAANLVGQIQTFGQTQPSSREVFSLEELLKNTVSFSNGALPEAAKLHLEIRPGLPAVKASQTQIDQCLVNLITNARHAVGETGQISITAEAFEVTREYAAQHRDLSVGSFAKVTVSDNGCGMDAAILARIFEPFYTTKSKGTGLGLATTYGIITNHGGTIEATSTLGAGSTFTLLLPAQSTPSKSAT